MAEYLNTQYAQPAVVFYCLNGILHNLAWNALNRSVLQPKLLLKDPMSVEFVKGLKRHSRFGFFVNVPIALLAWWYPYPALAISVSMWVYWLYVSLKTPQGA